MVVYYQNYCVEIFKTYSKNILSFHVRIYETLWISIDEKYIKIMDVLYETLPHQNIKSRL
jgi:hypothetical protein